MKTTDPSPPPNEARQVRNAHTEWTMDAVLEKLRQGEFGDLPPWASDLLTALVAALNDNANLSALEAMPAWRAAVALPID